jgi:hypothetical protein
MKEQLEEAAEKMYKQSYDEFGEATWDEGKLFHRKAGFIDGAKWQAEKMYSEEEVYHILCEHTAFLFAGGKSTLSEWFEQFKKK